MLTFNISILYNVINILVLFVLLKIFLFKPVTEIMEKRKAMIQQDLDDAKKAKDDAEQMKGEYEDTLNTAKNQAADIVKDAKTRAEVEYNSIIEQGNKDAAVIMANADKTIAQEKERAIKQSKAEMADLAIRWQVNLLKKMWMLQQIKSSLTTFYLRQVTLNDKFGPRLRQIAFSVELSY